MNFAKGQLVAATLLLIWGTGPLLAQETAPPAATQPQGQVTEKPDTEFTDTIHPFLKLHCLTCHGGPPGKAELRLDRLTPDFSNAASRQQWRLIQKRVEAGEMPPTGQPRPPANDRTRLLRWIETHARTAEAEEQTAQGRSVLRRLNRTEYENTIRDLLGIAIDLKGLLPPDSSAAGFDNVGEALHLSSFQLEKYLEAAETALNLAISNRVAPPPRVKKRYLLRNQHHVKTTTESVYRLLTDDTVVLFSSSPWNAVTLYEFYPAQRGRYRFRVSASGFQSGDKPVTYRLDAGNLSMTGQPSLVGYFDAPPDTPRVVEFEMPLEPTNTLRIHPYGLATAQAVHKIGADAFTGPGLAVQWVEVEGPINDTWPPMSHTRLFGNLERAPAPADASGPRVHVVSQSPVADARQILQRLARRAFRRPPTDEEIDRLLKLVTDRLAAGASLEQSVRVGLLAILVSPEFLFLTERTGQLDDFALASRLSYFLWSTLPDDELLELAQQGRLQEPAVLKGQAERLLHDPRSEAFTKNFVGQWLGLREIDFTEPTHILYPEFDDLLKVSMVRETELFFQEVLTHDLSLLNFIAADFSMLNGRLARHYGIPGVTGWEFRKTPLPADSHRGGVLTMASVMKVTANGTTTSPVTRGAWVLDRLLGTPPPKPPENVAALEPDIRGTTTIREQLARHREIESCAVCHRQMDPLGFALESFDAIGGWRDSYRISSWVRGAEPVQIEGRTMPYLRGRQVDPADTLADGRAFQNIDELKRLLLSDPDAIARALARRLVTYATGAPPTTADDPQIDALVTAARQQNYGFRTLVHAVIQSDLFRRK
ncbi:MAG: DUF1592 domain-containing protein [Planctomycetes bacterium]|nr:DUF1592 domain-containing protein [Planctomycetota bacterium]